MSAKKGPSTTKKSNAPLPSVSGIKAKKTLGESKKVSVPDKTKTVAKPAPKLTKKASSTEGQEKKVFLPKPVKKPVPKVVVIEDPDEEELDCDLVSESEDEEVENEMEELVPIEEGEIKSKFYIPSKGKYVNLRTMIKPSTIPGAGMGVFAVDKIPRGAEIEYTGLKKGHNTANHFYSWEVKTYDPETGEPDDEDILYFIDAADVRYSNCTRTVNCGMTSKANNMDAVQRFDRFYYIALRDIKPGEELFVDYGEQYRTVNLGMKGKY